MLIALSIAICLAFGSIGLAVGMRVDAPEKVQSLFPLLFVFLFLSSMNLPAEPDPDGLVPGDRDLQPGQLHGRGSSQSVDHGLGSEALALGFGCALGILAIGLTFASLGLKERMVRT